MVDRELNTGAVVGLDLGGTKLMAGLFDGDGTLVAKEYALTGSLNQDELLAVLATTVSELVARSEQQVVAAGYGVPTTIDRRTGRAVLASNLPIRDLDIQGELEERTGLRTFVDNDANTAALAEQRLGAGSRGIQNFLMLTLGTGVGGGIVIDGQLFGGSIGGGAELGHVSIDRDGPPCTGQNCPGTGCVETFCSGSALARDTAKFVAEYPESALAAAVRAGAPARGETVLEFAETGDVDAIELLTELGRNLGIALAGFVNIFNPEMICIGGGLTAAAEWILPAARETMVAWALPPANEFVQVVQAQFGPDAGMTGAAIMAREAWDAEQAVNHTGAAATLATQ